MIGSKNHKRKTAPKRRTATLPAGVKVVPAPKSAARRKLLSGPDIETSGGRRTVQPTKPPAGGQSEEAQLRTLIEKFAPAHHRLIGAIRRSLRKRLPAAHEIVYEYRDNFVISYSPSEKGYEGVLAIRGSADGVKLYFNRGNELPDPAKLLQGSGSLVRFIDVEGASTLSRPEVAHLIEEAIAHNPVPFAATGGGSVVIRSTSVKPRRRSRPATNPALCDSA